MVCGPWRTVPVAPRARQALLPFLGIAPERALSGALVRVAWRRANVHALAVGAVHAEDLDRLVAGRAEPVRHAGIELGDLARLHREVVLAKDQPHLACKHEEPLIARVGP